MSIGEPAYLPETVDASLTAYFGVSAELLRTIANVLDIRTVLPRLSEIANRMLPHDALALGIVDRDGHFGVEATTGDLPGVEPRAVKMALRDGLIIGDLTRESLPVVRGPNPTPRLVAHGYRSVLTTFTKAGEQVLGLALWSKQRNAYELRQLPLARSIVDHVAVAVSHERIAGMAGAAAGRSAPERGLERGARLSTEDLRGRMHTRIVGESAEWRDVLRKATQVAATDTTVLLTGESGTGKEVIARFVHRASARSAGPFVALNCAALPEQLLEAELFGYERGAFTGAQQAKPGQIELASGGVLFLDEVSEMSLTSQAKFLRVLQEREFQRLGGTRSLKAHIRVVAATNRDLRKAVERGDFREDLYYRLEVFAIRLAPLRERRSDVLPLTEMFLEEIGTSFGRPPIGLTRAAREALLRHDWPGNVRELRNALERAAIVCEGELIGAEHLSLHAAIQSRRPDTTDLNVVERATIADVMRDCRWNKSRAAERLGLSRTQLYGRLRKHGLADAAAV